MLDLAIPEFRARAPWLGGDLQTLRNFLLRPAADLTPWPARALELAMADGSGDRLLGQLQRPAESDGMPLVVLIHGLTGCQDSSYIRNSCRHLLRQGFAVLRLNLRGAGPARRLARGQYHAGRCEDLRDALLAMMSLVPEALAPGVFVFGYSLGGNMTLRFLAQEVGALRDQGIVVTGGVSVSAPIDLKAGQLRMMAPRNHVYHRYLLSRMKAESLESPGGVSPKAARMIKGLRSIYDFDDRVVAPAGGFAGADDYYAVCSARNFLPDIAVPTLLLHARDDPWIPARSYDSAKGSLPKNLRMVVSASGGHVGFHDSGGAAAWHDRVIGDLFLGLAGVSARSE